MPHPRADEPGVKRWDLLAENLALPDDDHTHYWCKIFKAPEEVDGDVKHQMIGVCS